LDSKCIKSVWGPTGEAYNTPDSLDGFKGISFRQGRIGKRGSKGAKGGRIIPHYCQFLDLVLCSLH